MMREPQPTDGPDYHAEHAYWRTHTTALREAEVSDAGSKTGGNDERRE